MTRRTFLKYVGAAATLPAWASDDAASVVKQPHWPAGSVPYPAPLPGDLAPDMAHRLASFAVRDELVLPEGFAFDLLATWGDRIGPKGRSIRFGFNCDYVGMVRRRGTTDEFWVLVNHEYISARSWLEGYPLLSGEKIPEVGMVYGGETARFRLGSTTLEGPSLPLEGPASVAARVDQARVLGRAALGDLGVSVLHVRRTGQGRYEVVGDSPHHKRVAGMSVTNIPADGLALTGPAARLLPAPRGTMCNCGGATTPWGSFLSCEENFQDYIDEDITPDGRPLRREPRRLKAVEGHPGLPLPHEFLGLAHAADLTLDGRTYGWVCEVDPGTGVLKKHSHLGRFRHENAAIRCEPGRPLVVYLGDDRRGGHVWKYVSREIIRDPVNPSNTRLLEDGLLFVSRWNPDFTGRWIPLLPETPVNPCDPAFCAHRELRLPSRPAGGTVAVGPDTGVTRADWLAAVAAYAGVPAEKLTLRDLVSRQNKSDQLGVILCDAFAMANACGGTPLARPEDIEVHPDDRAVYIAFTDERSDTAGGAPDTRIFPGAATKDPTSYGAIVRLVEDHHDPASETFTWGRFVSGNEAGNGGAGFACADNLCFAPDGELWVMCDVTTPALNHSNADGGGKHRNMGVFGNNALFRIATSGPDAGQPRCFATGPMDCEMTGLNFTPAGDAVLVSVQHPGEYRGTHGHPGQPEVETVEFTLHDNEGKEFKQLRTVPVGSNFPTGRKGATPKPAVVIIRPATSN